MNAIAPMTAVIPYMVAPGNHGACARAAGAERVSHRGARPNTFVHLCGRLCVCVRVSVAKIVSPPARVEGRACRTFMLLRLALHACGGPMHVPFLGATSGHSTLMPPR